jgi:hypothetical protein
MFKPNYRYPATIPVNGATKPKAFMVGVLTFVVGVPANHFFVQLYFGFHLVN